LNFKYSLSVLGDKLDKKRVLYLPRYFLIAIILS